MPKLQVRLKLNFSKEGKRVGLEIADYIASSFRACIRSRPNYCCALESKARFLFRALS